MSRLPTGPSGHDRQHEETLENDMRNKPLVIALIATTLTTATIATQASAGDPALGALLGAGVGAAIGNGVNHHNGAWVGGATRTGLPRMLNQRSAR